jgi:hypothetical protein
MRWLHRQIFHAQHHVNSISYDNGPHWLLLIPNLISSCLPALLIHPALLHLLHAGGDARKSAVHSHVPLQGSLLCLDDRTAQA